MKSHCRHCDTDSAFFTEEHTRLCFNCGVEERAPFNITYQNFSYQQAHSIPTDNTYNRRKRFATMLDSAVLGHNLVSDDKMLHYLSGGTYNTLADIVDAIKRSKLRDKRYASLHCFARIYANDYTRHPPIPNWFVLRKRVLNRFRDVEFVHRRTFTKPFMSYTWLLHQLLEEFGLGVYKRYVKTLKCKKRNKAYAEDYEIVRATLSHANRYAVAPGGAAGSDAPPSEPQDDRDPRRVQ
jgi:hypothetical protein